MRARGEIERLRAGLRAAAEGQRPEFVDGDRLAIRAFELIDELAARRVDIDAAVAEIADENVAAEMAEARRRHGETPRRVERTVLGKARQQIPVGVEDIDEAGTRAGDAVMLVGALLRIGDPERAVDVLDVEGRET